MTRYLEVFKKLLGEFCTVRLAENLGPRHLEHSCFTNTQHSLKWWDVPWYITFAKRDVLLTDGILNQTSLYNA